MCITCTNLICTSHATISSVPDWISCVPGLNLICTWIGCYLHLVWIICTWTGSHLYLFGISYVPGLDLICTGSGSHTYLVWISYVPGLDHNYTCSGSHSTWAGSHIMSLDRISYVGMCDSVNQPCSQYQTSHVHPADSEVCAREPESRNCLILDLTPPTCHYRVSSDSWFNSAHMSQSCFIRFLI